MPKGPKRGGQKGKQPVSFAAKCNRCGQDETALHLCAVKTHYYLTNLNNVDLLLYVLYVVICGG